MKKLLYFLSALCILTSCDAITGKEIARLPINAVSMDSRLITKEASADLKKGDEIAFWSDMDFYYEGDLKLLFQIEIKNGDKVLTVIEFDPTEKNISLNEKKTDMMGDVDWSFVGKNASYKVEEDGKYTFKGALFSNGNKTLELRKAEISIKK